MRIFLTANAMHGMLESKGTGKQGRGGRCMHGGPFPLRCPFPALAIGRVRMAQKYVVQRALSWDRADRPLARIWNFTKLETRQCLRYACVTGHVYNPQTARLKQTLYMLACGVIVQRDRITPAINLLRPSRRLM